VKGMASQRLDSFPPSSDLRVESPSFSWSLRSALSAVPSLPAFVMMLSVGVRSVGAMAFRCTRTIRVMSSGGSKTGQDIPVNELTGEGGGRGERGGGGGGTIGELRRMVSDAVTLKKSQGDLVSSSMASAFRTHYSTLSLVRLLPPPTMVLHLHQMLNPCLPNRRPSSNCCGS